MLEPNGAHTAQVSAMGRGNSRHVGYGWPTQTCANEREPVPPRFVRWTRDTHLCAPRYDAAGAQSLGFSLVYLGLRYDVELIHRIPYWPAPTDRNNVDPRIGFAWDPMGDQKWSVRGGLGAFTQQNPIFTILKGAVQGRYGIVQLSLPAGDPNFPVFPNALPGFPPGAVLPARNIQEISPDLENERGWQYSLGFQRQLGKRSSLTVDANVNRATKHGFLDVNQPAPIPTDVINGAGGKVVRSVAQADLTRPTPPTPNGFRRNSSTPRFACALY